jgi:anti-sigma factor RsiW
MHTQHDHHHAHGDIKRCQQLLGQLNDYIDGEIDSDLCAELERHMAECSDCQIVLDTLTKTVRLYHTLQEMPMQLDPAIEARLMGCLNLPHKTE